MSSKEFVFDSQYKFVGNFEGLYNEDNCPWGQDENDPRLKEYYHESRNKLGETISQIEMKSLLEVGCGLGYALNEITKYTNATCRGCDISKTAIKKASQIFPQLVFFQADLRKDKVESDVVILNEILWYLLEELETSLKNITCKHLIINNGFLENQHYGKDIVDGFNGLIRYLLDNHYTITYARYKLDGSSLKNGLVVCEK